MALTEKRLLCNNTIMKVQANNTSMMQGMSYWQESRFVCARKLL